MNATTVAVDLAKNVFEVALADDAWRIRERHRLSRGKFARFFANRARCRIVMEACGSAHHWARTLSAQGHDPLLLPAQYVRAYVKRNKTDRADASALIEAVRSSEIRPVPVKSIEQQLIQQLHRLRSQWMRTRTARINGLRGILREFGIVIARGAQRGLAEIRAALADNALPDALRPAVAELLTEIDALERRSASIEQQLRELTREDPIVQVLMRIPGIGLLTATALRATIVDVQRFPSGRHLASYLGLTAREYSSGERRRLGRISKRGDVYLRTLLIHGARAVLNAALRVARTGRPLDRLRTWAIATEQRCGYNKATVALANKLARIAWATWKYQRAFDGNRAIRARAA
ncbi:MAG: IS110 family transposase [Steroidobacteraceae bacterium]